MYTVLLTRIKVLILYPLVIALDALTFMCQVMIDTFSDLVYNISKRWHERKSEMRKCYKTLKFAYKVGRPYSERELNEYLDKVE